MTMFGLIIELNEKFCGKFFYYLAGSFFWQSYFFSIDVKPGFPESIQIQCFTFANVHYIALWRGSLGGPEAGWLISIHATAALVRITVMFKPYIVQTLKKH